MKIKQVLAAAIITAGLGLALQGCQTEMAVVPGNARLVASATGTSSYSAGQNGTLYIYDKTWNKLVYAGEVNAGQLVQVDTAKNEILVDNQPRVEQANVGGGSQFQFYLLPSSTVTTVRRTVIEQPTIQRETVTTEQQTH